MVINRISLQIPSQNHDNSCYRFTEISQKSITNSNKFNYDQGGFTGGIRAKRLQDRLRNLMLPPPPSYKMIKKAVVQETLSKTLPKNPLLSFIHNAELLLMNILACKFIR